MLPIGHAEVLRNGSNIMIWALGNNGARGVAAGRTAGDRGNLSVGVVNARFAKPLDRTLLLSHAACIPLIVTMEDHVLAGWPGSAVLEVLQEADCPTTVERIGWPDKFVEHGSSVERLRAAYGLAPADMYRRVLDRWRNRNTAQVEADV